MMFCCLIHSIAYSIIVHFPYRYPHHYNYTGVGVCEMLASSTYLQHLLLLFQAVRTVRRASKCFYMYLNIDIPQCKYKRATRKRNRLNDLAYESAAAYVEHAFARPMLAYY